jgi:hypothetical protein
MRSSQLLSQCQPIKSQDSCEILTIAKVKEYAQLCGVNHKDPNGKARKREDICADLAQKYLDIASVEEVKDTELRHQLNRVYFNLYFADKATQAGMIRKLFFGDSIKKLDQLKKEFIDLLVSVYSHLDRALNSENQFRVVEALYQYGQAVNKLAILIGLNHEIKVEKKFKSARSDLTRTLTAQMQQYTQKLVILTESLHLGNHIIHQDQYRQFLHSQITDLNNFKVFTLHGSPVLAKVLSVHDGDTCTAVLQVKNSNEFYKWNLRAFGYDAYEVSSKNLEHKRRADVGRQVLVDLVLNRVIMIQALPETDKYGRLLCHLYIQRSDLPPNFDFRPRYLTILTGLGSNKEQKEIQVRDFAQHLKKYFPQDPNMIYINQLMLDLGVAIPYLGNAKEL